MTGEPFPPELFDNEITLSPRVESTNPQGGPGATWPEVTVTSPASVQPSSVTMTDPQGRIVVATMYDIFTPSDIGAKARDKIGWEGKHLTPQGPTIDAGGCGVLWKTTCTETTQR